MISASTPMICTGTHVTYKRAKKIFSRCSCARRTFEAYRYACAASCEYTVFLLVCTHVGDKHMWQAKQSCHWWDCNVQGACASMPMLAPRALNYLLTAASRMGHWQGQKPAPTTRRAQPSEQLRHAAMLSLQKPGTARKQAEDVLSHQESGTPRGTMTKLPITNAVTSRQVQLDRSMYTCKKACWRIALALYSTPHSRQLLQSVLIRGYPWKCSRDFAVSLGSFLTSCDLGDFFGSPAMSVVALSNAWSRLAETQGNRADKLRNN